MGTIRRHNGHLLFASTSRPGWWYSESLRRYLRFTEGRRIEIALRPQGEWVTAQIVEEMGSGDLPVWIQRFRSDASEDDPFEAAMRELAALLEDAAVFGHA